MSFLNLDVEVDPGSGHSSQTLRGLLVSRSAWFAAIQNALSVPGANLSTWYIQDKIDDRAKGCGRSPDVWVSRTLTIRREPLEPAPPSQGGFQSLSACISSMIAFWIRIFAAFLLELMSGRGAHTHAPLPPHQWVPASPATLEATAPYKFIWSAWAGWGIRSRSISRSSPDLFAPPCTSSQPVLPAVPWPTPPPLPRRSQALRSVRAPGDGTRHLGRQGPGVPRTSVPGQPARDPGQPSSGQDDR